MCLAGVRMGGGYHFPDFKLPWPRWDPCWLGDGSGGGGAGRGESILLLLLVVVVAGAVEAAPQEDVEDAVWVT